MLSTRLPETSQLKCAVLEVCPGDMAVHTLVWALVEQRGWTAHGRVVCTTDEAYGGVLCHQSNKWVTLGDFSSTSGPRAPRVANFVPVMFCRIFVAGNECVLYPNRLHGEVR